MLKCLKEQVRQCRKSTERLQKTLNTVSDGNGPDCARASAELGKIRHQLEKLQDLNYGTLKPIG
jgi:hypothetical protein